MASCSAVNSARTTSRFRKVRLPPPDPDRRQAAAAGDGAKGAREAEKSLQDRRDESPRQRAERIRDWERKRQKQRAFTRELLEAMDFSLLGTEELRGRKAG